MTKLGQTLDFMGDHPVLTGFLALVTIGSVADCATGYYKSKPEVKYEQIVGSPIEDTYIELNGVKYFSKIDGLPVEEPYKK